MCNPSMPSICAVVYIKRLHLFSIAGRHFILLLLCVGSMRLSRSFSGFSVMILVYFVRKWICWVLSARCCSIFWCIRSCSLIVCDTFDMEMDCLTPDICHDVSLTRECLREQFCIWEPVSIYMMIHGFLKVLVLFEAFELFTGQAGGAHDWTSDLHVKWKIYFGRDWFGASWSSVLGIQLFTIYIRVWLLKRQVLCWSWGTLS